MVIEKAEPWYFGNRHGKNTSQFRADTFPFNYITLLFWLGYVAALLNYYHLYTVSKK